MSDYAESGNITVTRETMQELRAEIAALRQRATAAESALAASQARAKLLEDALRGINNRPRVIGDNLTPQSVQLNACLDIARAALSSTKGADQ